MIPLIARPLQAQAQTGLQPVGLAMSRGWRPPLSVVAPGGEASPGGWATPYARAVNTAYLLSELPSSAGTQPVKQVERLLLALVLGELELELIDMSQTQAGSFERALRNAEPSIERFWALRDSTGVVFGYSFPTCLAWPHARRVTSEWETLNTRIGDREGLARGILARFRDALDGFGGLGPASVPPPWKIALDHFTQGRAGVSDAVWENDVSFDGPVQLSFPEREGRAREEFVYLPVYREGIAQRFDQVRQLALQGGQLVDGRGVRHGSLQLPHGTGPHLPRGTGGCEVSLQPGLKPVERSASGDLANLLAPVVAELVGMGRPLKDCQQRPFAFPDSVRWLALAGYFDGGGAVQLTTWFRGLRAQRAGIPNPPADAGIQWAGTQYVEAHADVYVGDLAAIGAALYVAFSTDMSVTHGLVHDALGKPLLQSTDSQPLEATNEAHALVAQEPPTQPHFPRLATLQRFVSTYEAAAAVERGGPNSQRATLLARAASAYAERSYGAPVRPLGTQGSWDQHLTLASSERVPVAQDAHLPLRRVF